MEDKILRKLQLVELDMLKELDKYCKSNNINYTLYGGTSLGAVRHKGFIPWDDDIDIAMTRVDFERFCEKWQNNPIKGYTLQNILTDKNCSINHTKIRKNNTRMCTYEYETNLKNQGIWIDIFVLDKVKNSLFSKIYMLFWASLRVIFSRGNAIGKNDDSKIIKLFKKFICIFPQKIRNKIVIYSDKKMSKYKKEDNNFYLVDFSAFSWFHIKYPSEIIKKYSSIFFEKYNFPIYENTDLFLKIQYNDYMKLPPIEERICKHNPYILEFQADKNK